MILPFHHEHIAETISTNSVVLERAQNGAPEGLVFSTDFQTGGRGKRDRTWIAPKGKNLLFSILLRPPVSASQAPMLTQLAGQAVASAIENHCGLKPDFKRPNDLLIKGKKICGILVESSSSSGQNHIDYAVMGIGLNVNAEESELPEGATSLAVVKGQKFSLEALLDEILVEIREKLSPLYKK